jgi:hypothetical protein
MGHPSPHHFLHVSLQLLADALEATLIGALISFMCVVLHSWRACRVDKCERSLYGCSTVQTVVFFKFNRGQHALKMAVRCTL